MCLSAADGPVTILLVSDGIETCGGGLHLKLEVEQGTVVEQMVNFVN